MPYKSGDGETNKRADLTMPTRISRYQELPPLSAFIDTSYIDKCDDLSEGEIPIYLIPEVFREAKTLLKEGRRDRKDGNGDPKVVITRERLKRVVWTLPATRYRS